MTDPSSASSPSRGPAVSAPSAGSATSQQPSSAGSELVTAKGTTSIADGVVRKIAGIATREVSGVYNLGSGGSRTFGAIRERIPGSSGPNISQGVSVEVGERQAAIDLDVVIEYGLAVADLAQAIRRNVISSVERIAGLQVSEVNISVEDIHIDSDEDAEPEPARVQ